MPPNRSNKRNSVSGATSPYGTSPPEKITYEEYMQRVRTRSASVSRTEVHNPSRRNSTISGARGVATPSTRDSEQSNHQVPAGQKYQNVQLPSIASLVPATHLRLDQPIHGASLPQVASAAEQRKTFENSMTAVRPDSLEAYKRCIHIPPASAIPRPGGPLQVPNNHTRIQSIPQASTSKSVPLNPNFCGNSMSVERPSMSQQNLTSCSPHVPPPLGENYIVANNHVFGHGPFTDNNIQTSNPLSSTFKSQWNSGSPLRPERSASRNARHLTYNTQMSEPLPSSNFTFQWNSANPLGPEGSASRSGVSNVPAHENISLIGDIYVGSLYTGDRRGTNAPQPASSYVHPQFEDYIDTKRGHGLAMGESGLSASSLPYVPAVTDPTSYGYRFLESSRFPIAPISQNLPPKEKKEK